MHKLSKYFISGRAILTGLKFYVNARASWNEEASFPPQTLEAHMFPSKQHYLHRKIVLHDSTERQLEPPHVMTKPPNLQKGTTAD